MAHTVTIDASNPDQSPSFVMENKSEGLWRQTQNEYVETNEGIKHRFQDVTLESEQNEGHFDFSDYATTLNTAYPSLQSAIAWAAKGGAPSFDAAAFNASVDKQDLTEINAGAERLIALYEEANQAPPEKPVDEADDSDEEEFTDLDDWYVENVSDEFVESTLSQITDASFDSTQVEAMQDLASSYEAGTPEAAILRLGVAIGNGQMSGDDAISLALDKFSEPQLAAAYIRLTQQLN